MIEGVLASLTALFSLAKACPLRQRRGAAVLALFLLLGSRAARSHDVITTKITWSREMSRLFSQHCTSCHSAAGQPRFSLARYEEARPWAKAIKEQVLTRQMPPWGAVKGFGDFAGDLSLTQEEISLIADWVEGGAPEGDPALLPQSAPAASSIIARAPAGRPLLVHDQMTLRSSTSLSAILPTASGAAAKVFAVKPDGGVEPLLWLYQYRRRPVPFVYTRPLLLPRGTVIRCEPDIPLTLWVQEK